MYIFLDLDGVLAREDSPANDIEENPIAFDPECLNTFESVVREYESAKIVIASPWREMFPLDTICALFSPDIAARIAGAAPLATFPDKYYRYREITAYLEHHQITHDSWLVVACQRDSFPPQALVIAPNPNRGFSSDDAQELKQFLDSFSTNAPNDESAHAAVEGNGTLGLAWDSTGAVYSSAFALLAPHFQRCVIITLNDELTPDAVAQTLNIAPANVILEVCPEARIADSPHWKVEICRLHGIDLMFDADEHVVKICRDSGIQVIGVKELET
jgi:hypothetical protein